MPDPGASHAYTRLGRFALIVTTLLLGSSFTIMKDALATVPALWLLAIRFSGAAMLMALIGIRSLRRLDRGYLTGGACMGVCLYLAYTIQTYGLVHTTPGKNAFLAATYCVFVPFFWWLIHKRRPDRYNLAAALLCLCGMGLVSRQSDLRIGRGEGLTILSGVFYALHIIATASAARGRSPVLLSFVQFAVAAVLSWVTAPFAAPAPEEIPADVWLRLGYLCVMCSGLCGHGLGATPTAIVNMTAVTERYGMSSRAFMVVPIVGAFLVDLIYQPQTIAFIKFFVPAASNLVG